jgi:hypothetical protein
MLVGVIYREAIGFQLFSAFLDDELGKALQIVFANEVAVAAFGFSEMRLFDEV